MTVTIRPETADDFAPIREVIRLAFGQDDEGRLVDALRAGGHVQVSMLAEEDGRVVGHILFSELSIVEADRVIESVSLAPLAVAPSHQRRGIGSRLVTEGLRACRDVGCESVVVLGHPEYYPRFGFSAERALPLRSPYAGPAFMAMELVPGALEGVSGEVRYPPPFEALS